MKKVLASALTIGLLATNASALAVNINETREEFTKIQKELNESYKKQGDKIIEKLDKKYNKEELQYLAKKVDVVIGKYESQKLSEKNKKIVQLLKYIGAGIKLKIFEKKDKKFKVINEGKITRAENHVFKINFYEKIDGYFKTKGYSNAFLVAENKLVMPLSEYRENDGISVCQSTSSFDLVTCTFLGSLVKKEGNLALIEIADKDINGKAVSIQPDYEKSEGLAPYYELTSYYFTKNEVDNMNLKDNLSSESKFGNELVGSALIDNADGVAGIVLKDGSENKLTLISDIETKLKPILSEKAEAVKNREDLSNQLKLENDVYLSEKDNFEGKVEIKNLFKDFSRFDFLINSSKDRDYIIYDTKDFENEIVILNIKKDDIQNKIKEIGEKILTKEVMDSDACKKGTNSLSCTIEYEKGKEVSIEFKHSDSKLVYMITHATTKEGKEKSKNFSEKVMKNIIFK